MAYDLELPPRYFERLMALCESDPWLGTVSGKLFLRRDDGLVEERCGDENSVGPSKFYRVACFREIGGFVRDVCWDGIDGHLCRLKGWVAGYACPSVSILTALSPMAETLSNPLTRQSRSQRMFPRSSTGRSRRAASCAASCRP